MSIKDLIESAREEQELRPLSITEPKWGEMADAAEKELADITRDLERAEGKVLFGDGPRIDLEALRKALEVNLDPFTYGGTPEWHEVRNYLRKVKCDLAQLEGAKGQQEEVAAIIAEAASHGDHSPKPVVCMPKGEAQTKRRMDTPENREFWAGVDRAKEEVATQPGWSLCGAGVNVKEPEAQMSIAWEDRARADYSIAALQKEFLVGVAQTCPTCRGWGSTENISCRACGGTGKVGGGK